jgi:hypothetical protein
MRCPFVVFSMLSGAILAPHSGGGKQYRDRRAGTLVAGGCPTLRTPSPGSGAKIFRRNLTLSARHSANEAFFARRCDVGSDFEDSLHLLVFACGKCASLIAVSKTSTMRSLEEVDARTFSLRCPCGWTGKLIGLQARQHSVVSCPLPSPAPRLDYSPCLDY